MWTRDLGENARVQRQVNSLCKYIAVLLLRDDFLDDETRTNEIAHTNPLIDDLDSRFPRR